MAASRTLAARLKDAVVTNWPIKLTALILSAVLWAAVAAEEPTTQEIPVNLVLEAPPGRGLNGSLPAVSATYLGPWREITKLFTSPPIVRKVVPDTVSGTEFTVTLSLDDLLADADVDARAQAIQPAEFVVTLDDVTRRAVRVTPRVQINPDSGYMMVGGLAVTPSRVTVVGPDSIVRSIRDVPTMPVSLTGVRAPVGQTVPLDTTGLSPARVIPEVVEITASIAVITERVLMGVPVAVQGDGATWTVDPPAVIVTVRGPNTRVARLTRDSLSVTAVAPAAGDTVTVAVEVVPPSGITAASTPDSAVLIRRGRG